MLTDFKVLSAELDVETENASTTLKATLKRGIWP